MSTCNGFIHFKWQETFGFQNLDQYHGTGAFNTSIYGTWDAVLLDILSRPKQIIVIRARRRGAGHGGWSKNNPYLPDVSWWAVKVDLRIFESLPHFCSWSVLSNAAEICRIWDWHWSTIVGFPYRVRKRSTRKWIRRRFGYHEVSEWKDTRFIF